MTPQFAQMTEIIALAIFVPEHRKNELRWKCAAQQIGDVPQQIKTMVFDESTGTMSQSIPAIKQNKFQFSGGWN